MKFLAFLLLSVVSVAAKDIREIRFPFADEKEMAAFIKETGDGLTDPIQRRVWENGLGWMREHAEAKRSDFWQWLRGMHATDAINVGYATHGKLLADRIEAIANEARQKNGEEAARLKMRVAELSKNRDAIFEELALASRMPTDAGNSSGTGARPHP